MSLRNLVISVAVACVGVSSALFVMGDSDGDDIPDSGFVVGFATSSRLAIAGVTIDSFGDVYWLTTDRVIGVISKAWDVDEDRIPDIGFANYNACLLYTSPSPRD